MFRVVDYWNSIDEKLEIELDILDDFKSEAEVGYQWNISYTNSYSHAALYHNSKSIDTTSGLHTASLYIALENSESL